MPWSLPLDLSGSAARLAGRLLRNAGYALNRCFSWNPSLARAYLEVWASLLRLLPDGSWLRLHIGNNLRQTQWPQIELGPSEVELAPGIQALLVPAAGSLSFRALYERHIGHEPGVAGFLHARMPDYDAVLEVGANVGLYTLLFSKALAGRAELGSGPHRIFSYEPDQRAFSLLRRHLQLNGCTNVRAFNVAVASTSGPIAFHENSRDWMKGTSRGDVAALFPGAGPATSIPAVSGTQIAPLLQPYLRLLFKIDVVGAESDVLMGLRDVILERRPDIVLGVWQWNRDALNRLEFLRECYHLTKLAPDGLIERTAFTDDSYCNYFLQSIPN